MLENTTKVTRKMIDFIFSNDLHFSLEIKQNHKIIGFSLILITRT